MIATLLVPLNFLGMASLSREHWSLVTLATELVSLGVFAWLVSLAGRVLVPEEGTPLAIPAVVVVAAALAGLIAAALTFAVVGRLDPLGLSDRGRTAYVYAA